MFAITAALQSVVRGNCSHSNNIGLTGTPPLAEKELTQMLKLCWSSVGFAGHGAMKEGKRWLQGLASINRSQAHIPTFGVYSQKTPYLDISSKPALDQPPSPLKGTSIFQLFGVYSTPLQLHGFERFRDLEAGLEDDYATPQIRKELPLPNSLRLESRCSKMMSYFQWTMGYYGV